MSCASFCLIFIGSFAIGTAVAFITTYILKYFRESLDDPNKKSINRAHVAIMTAAPFLSYLIAQGLVLSGIMSILFCGFVLSQYAAEMLNVRTRNVLKVMYQTCAYVCESTVFMFLGMSAVEFYGAYAYFCLLIS
jgi:NhaP-type Na+/H+ or K+/H+ antiporter